MANTGFKGVDVRQTGSQLVFEFFLQDSSGAKVTSGTTTLKLYEVQSDGTLKSYDFTDNTFKTTALTTETASMTHQTGNNGTTNTGIWTYALATLTGFTTGAVYHAQVNNSSASPTDQTRKFQYGGAEGDLLVTAGSTGQAYLQDNCIKIGGTTQTARDIGASVLISSGTGTGQLDVTSGLVNVGKINSVSTSSVTTVNANVGTTQPTNFTGTGSSAYVKCDTVDFAGQTITCSGGVTIPAATLASTTNITAATGITVSTNSDKTGYSLTQAFPSNFSSLAITVGGAVTAGTVSDKTGYSITQSFPANFSSLSIDVSGRVDLGKILGTASQGAAGYVGPDWSHVNAPTTTVGLTGTTVDLVNSPNATARTAIASTVASTLFVDGATNTLKVNSDHTVNSTGGGGGGSGSGAYTAVITINDGATALANVRVSAFDAGILSASAVTNGSGQVTLSLDAGTYSINAYKTGYSGSVNSLTITTGTTQTYSITALAVSPSAPPYATGYLTVSDNSGNAIAGVLYIFSAIGFADGDTGESTSKTSWSVHSDSNGLVQTSFISGARYYIQQGTNGTQVKFTAGNTTFELPSTVG